MSRDSDLDAIQASLDAYETYGVLLGDRRIDIERLISEIRRLRTVKAAQDAKIERLRNVLDYAVQRGMGTD